MIKKWTSLNNEIHDHDGVYDLISVFLLVLVLIKMIYQALKTIHLKVCKKYSTGHCIFDFSVFGNVVKCGLSCLIYIASNKQ